MCLAFQIFLSFPRWFLYLRMLVTCLRLKLPFRLSLVSNVFEKLVNDRLLIIGRYVTFFLISSMALNLLDQLQIFLQLYLIELLELSTGLGLL